MVFFLYFPVVDFLRCFETLIALTHDGPAWGNASEDDGGGR